MEGSSASTDISALTRLCPLCGSDKGRLQEELHFALFDNTPVSGHCRLVSCSRCGFGFFDTQSKQADFDRYYEQNAYYCTATTAGTGGIGTKEQVRFEMVAERISPQLLTQDAVIIDVGCAKGGLLKVLAQRGFTRLYGVDMLPECISYIQRTMVISAELGSALSLPFPDLWADAMIYSHVIEHVIDLQSLIAAAHEKLADRGILYVEVPDASEYGEHTVYPFQDFYLEHVNHFSLSTLSALFCSAGFSVVNSGKYALEAPAGKVPCVWAVFRKGYCPPETPDRALERHLHKYVSWSRNHPANHRFARLAADRTPLYLWGISQYAMLSLGQSPICNCNIRGFVDKDPSKRMRTIRGNPINSPDALRNTGPDCAVLVTAPGYEASIREELDQMGFGGTVLDASGAVIGGQTVDDE